MLLKTLDLTVISLFILFLLFNFFIYPIPPILIGKKKLYSCHQSWPITVTNDDVGCKELLCWMIINNFLNHESGTRFVLLFYNWIKWIFKSIWFAFVFMQIHNNQSFNFIAHDFWIKYHSVIRYLIFFWSLDFESCILIILWCSQVIKENIK
jgi:hypothetical protein